MDIGKLVLDLEKQKQQINQLSNIERKELARRQILQQSTSRKIGHMKNRLNTAETIKQQALHTIQTFRKVQEVAPSTDPIIWAQNYAELLDTYEETVHENEKLRTQLAELGVETVAISSAAHPFKKPEEIGNKVINSTLLSPLYPSPPSSSRPISVDASIIQQRNALRSLPINSNNNLSPKIEKRSFDKKIRSPPKMPIIGTPIVVKKNN